MVRMDQWTESISFPFTAGCKTSCVIGRSSDSSRLLTLPICTVSDRIQTVVIIQKPQGLWAGPHHFKADAFSWIHSSGNCYRF